jgi:hypothetical protein
MFNEVTIIAEQFDVNPEVNLKKSTIEVGFSNVRTFHGGVRIEV